MARRLETAPAPAEAVPPAHAVDAGGLQILLVDDRTENLHALEAVLGPLGVPLVSTTSGGGALRLILERDFAVILLDVRMPGMDGLETARLIKQRERTRDVPIVFLTAARDDVQDVMRGYEAGAVDYVLKPFDPDLLRSKVATLVELQRSRRALERSEALLRGAFDYAPIGKTVLDGARHIVRANPAFGRLLKAEPAALETRDVADLAHPEDRATLVQVLNRAANREPGATQDSGGVDLRLRSANDADVWVELVASSVEANELTEPLVLAQWVDVSVRRRAEQGRAQLLLEQSARSHAEAATERLQKLQGLTDAFESLSLDRLLGELASRMAELFDAVACEVSVGEVAERQTVVRTAGGRELSSADEAALSRAALPIEVPLRIERHGVGSLRLHLPAERTFRPADHSLLHEASDRAALAVRQAQLYEEEHRIAVELQRGLMPKSLPLVPGVRISAHYEAAGVAAEVGGDWYDAFALGGGRVGLVIGDVAGRGIAAASAMGQLRAVARAIAVQDDYKRRAGEVLTRLNRYHLALGEDQYVTAIYAIVDPRNGTFEWACAGHLPPLLRTRAAETRYLNGGAYPLGTEDVEYEVLSEPIAAGDALVLYTDGLVERRGESIDDGLARLAAAVHDGPLEPQALAARLRESTDVPTDQLPDDVTAVLVEIA